MSELIKPEKDFLIGTTKLEESCQAYLDFVDSDDYCADASDNYENEIFEYAMKAVFGKKVFDYISARQE